MAFCILLLESCNRADSVSSFSNSVLTSFLQKVVSVILSPSLRPDSLCPARVFSSVSLVESRGYSLKFSIYELIGSLIGILTKKNSLEVVFRLKPNFEWVLSIWSSFHTVFRYFLIRNELQGLYISQTTYLKHIFAIKKKFHHTVN